LKKFFAAIFRGKEKFNVYAAPESVASAVLFSWLIAAIRIVSFGPKGNKPKAIGPKSNIQAHRLFDGVMDHLFDNFESVT
jgi:hypothetical protein